MFIRKHNEVYGHRGEPTLDNNNNIIDFPRDKNNIISFKFKQHITGQT